MTNEQLVARIQVGDDTAANMAQLYEQTKRYIHAIAKRYEGSADLDDLDQEGYLALYAAIENYDPAHGCKFLTYAEYWIRQRMQRYIQNNGTVRIPVHEWERQQEYKKLVNAYVIHLCRKPTRCEIAYHMGLSYKQVIELEKSAWMAQLGSLDKPLSEDGESTVSDLITDNSVDVEEEVLAAADQERLREALWPIVDSLPEEQGIVLRARFQEGKTLKETGEGLGVTIERTRTIESNALRNLRRSRNARLLRSFLPEESEIYSRAIVGNSVERFNTTWTSSTERAAMKEW